MRFFIFLWVQAPGSPFPGQLQPFGGVGPGAGASTGQAGVLQHPPDSKLETDPGNNRVSESKW